jgi:hypothetical protein
VPGGARTARFVPSLPRGADSSRLAAISRAYCARRRLVDSTRSNLRSCSRPTINPLTSTFG